MFSFMHKRLAQQANVSLGKPQVEKILMQEASKQKIAMLR
jgi:hypothetical protein